MASISRRLTLTTTTTLLQNPTPFSQSFLHHISPLSTTSPSTSDPLTTFLFSPPNLQSSNLSPPSTGSSNLRNQRSIFSTRTTQTAYLFSQISNASFQRSNLFLSNPISILPTHNLSYPIHQFSKTHICHPQRRHLSSSPDPTNPSGAPLEAPEFRHQEITGPTVEPDNSALANETRSVLESLRKAIYDLSLSLALLGAAHLGLGAWMSYTTELPREVMVQGIAAFAFPFTLAFLMQRTLKPLSFFIKMEEQGRLQVLTLALQSSKNLRAMLLRARVVAMFCVLGVSVGSVSAIWMQ